MRICVYGSSSTAIDEKYLKISFELGRLMAQSNIGLVFGAGDMGVMGAVARGAQQAGGEVIGVLPRFMNIDGIPFRGCDELILTDTMRERKQIMEDLSDGFVAAPGGFGTFEELLEILTLKQLARHNKSIVVLDADGFYQPLLAMFQKAVDEKFAKPQILDAYSVQSTAQGTIEYLKNYQPQKQESKWFHTHQTGGECYADEIEGDV